MVVCRLAPMPSAVPSLCSFLLVVFRLIGTLNQFFIPRNQLHQTSTLKHLPLILSFSSSHPFPLHISLRCYWLTMSSEYTFHTCHDLYTPTLLFAKAHSFLSLSYSRDLYAFFIFTLLSKTNRVSSLVASSLWLSHPPPDRVCHFSAVYERCFGVFPFNPVLLGFCPVYFFFCFPYITYPYRYSRTGYDENFSNATTLFAYFAMFDSQALVCQHGVVRHPGAL
ncbi:hypothetical protein BC826DRAFT_711190 [Russula brevipes]|nr:hypothetical protein BC826DRAFT_711190 [Russula brevipes]